MSTLHKDSVEVVSFMETIELSGGRAHTGHIIARLGWETEKILQIAKECFPEIRIKNRTNPMIFTNSQFQEHERFRREGAFRRMCGTEGLVHTHRYGYVDPRRFGDAG